MYIEHCVFSCGMGDDVWSRMCGAYLCEWVSGEKLPGFPCFFVSILCVCGFGCVTTWTLNGDLFDGQRLLWLMNTSFGHQGWWPQDHHAVYYIIVVRAHFSYSSLAVYCCCCIHFKFDVEHRQYCLQSICPSQYRIGCWRCATGTSTISGIV